ncbi:3-hydroxyisobutyryl-coa hydrolase-like protein 1, partial [Quercus suber]
LPPFFPQKLALIEEQLGKLATDDPSLDNISVLHKIEILDKCFSHDTVEEIIDALKLLHYNLTTILAQILEGRFQTLDQCLIREYRMSLQGISNQFSRDFCEGVWAQMLDKDQAPKVSSAYVISLLDKWGSNIANIAFKNPI